MKNDPWQRLRDDLRAQQKTAQSTTKRKFPSAVRKRLDANWSGTGHFFSSLPLDSKLALVLTLLLRADSQHFIWSHALDFGIDQVIQNALRETGRTLLREWVDGDLDRRTRLSSNLPVALGAYYTGVLGDFLVVGRNVSERPAMHSVLNRL